MQGLQRPSASVLLGARPDKGSRKLLDGTTNLLFKARRPCGCHHNTVVQVSLGRLSSFVDTTYVVPHPRLVACVFLQLQTVLTEGDLYRWCGDCTSLYAAGVHL